MEEKSKDFKRYQIEQGRVISHDDPTHALNTSIDKAKMVRISNLLQPGRLVINGVPCLLSCRDSALLYRRVPFRDIPVDGHGNAAHILYCTTCR